MSLFYGHSIRKKPRRPDTDFLEDASLQHLLPYPQHRTPEDLQLRCTRVLGRPAVGVSSCLTTKQGCPRLPELCGSPLKRPYSMCVLRLAAVTRCRRLSNSTQIQAPVVLELGTPAWVLKSRCGQAPFLLEVLGRIVSFSSFLSFPASEIPHSLTPGPFSLFKSIIPTSVSLSQLLSLTTSFLSRKDSRD